MVVVSGTAGDVAAGAAPHALKNTESEDAVEIHGRAPQAALSDSSSTPSASRKRRVGMRIEWPS